MFEKWSVFLESFAPIFGTRKVDGSQIVNDRLLSRHLD